MKMKRGFTLIELLVVMVIIAVLAGLLLPAVRKSRSKALVDKANAEMAALASVVTMAKLDCGYYVRLCDLSLVDADITDGGEPYYYTEDYSDPTAWAPLFSTTPADNPKYDDSAKLEAVWEGPYQVFQEKGVLGTTYGSIPTWTGMNWNSADFPDGSPLDPWGRAYCMSYNYATAAALDRKAMVIYSAGPNGRMETYAGAVVVGDSDGDGTQDDNESDDIIYKFR